MISHGLLVKEWTESVRMHRILILPLVFLLLGMAQPIMYHFMPDILDQAGLPEGMIIEMPPIKAEDVVAGVFDQLNQVGVLTIILVSMGLFGREIQSGLAGFLVSLGISRFSYFTAKWTVLALITLASTLLGVAGAAYYTNILFTALPWGVVALAAVAYFLHLAFILTLSVSLNAVIVSPLVSAGTTLGIAIVLGLLGTVRPSLAPWLPGHAVTVAKALLYGTTEVSALRYIVPFAWIGLLFYLGYMALRRRDL